MTKLPLIVLLGTLTWLPSCCATRTVPVLFPAEPCPAPVARPLPPSPSAHACGPEVCLSPADAAAVWQWAREQERRNEIVDVCLDGRS